MSNFSYDDFAVLVRSFTLDMLSPESLKSLRIVPLSDAPSMADAIKGIPNVDLNTVNANLPLQKDGKTVVDSNVTVQHDSAGYCRLVGHIEATAETAVTTAKAFVLYHLSQGEGAEGGKKAEVIAVASLKEGFAIGDVCYPSFTITTVNNYQSVAFNPNAFATVEDLKSINGLDGLHIAFDTASGDLKLLDKDGNVLDQANLPIKADVIIAEGEEGYKYVKTDVKQDIHAAKAWMPEGKTAWEAEGEVPYTMSHAALVVEKVSSRVFVSTKPFVQLPISTQTVEIPHVEIGGSTYMVADLTEQACRLFRVKGDNGSPTYSNVTLSENKVLIHGASTADPAEPVQRDVTTSGVEVDVITFEDTLCVLGETENSGYQRYRALPTNSVKDIYLEGGIVTSGGSSTASRVFVDPQSGSYPISIKSVQFDHVVIGDSIYMVTDKNETECHLRKVKGGAEAPTVISHANLLNGSVTYNSDSYPITNKAVDVDVIKVEGATYVLAGTGRPEEFQARSLDGGSTQLYLGIIVTFGGSTTGEVLGIALADQEGTKMYTFDEGAQPHAVIKNISGSDVRWLDIKPLNEVPNHTLKYGLEAFVWTVKGEGDVSNEPFFQQLNKSLLALGFHEGDDIALGTNLSKLAPTDGGVSPLNKVDADKYMHGKDNGKDNKATREQEVDDQRKLAKDELVAWNAQHPEFVHDGVSGTRISFDGVDIRNGKIEIGNGVANDDNDSVKRYVIETDIADGDGAGDGAGAGAGKGLQISVVDSQTKSGDGDGATYSDVQKDILTINAEDYISGAPTCLALLKCSKNESAGTVSAGLEGGRITANFNASGAEREGVFTLTITDKRANNGFGVDPRIVEIIPVYKSGADATEAVPAQRSISAIKVPEKGTENTLSIRCSQVIDWAQSIALGGGVSPEGKPVPNGMELYLIVKVY